MLTTQECTARRRYTRSSTVQHTKEGMGVERPMERGSQECVEGDQRLTRKMGWKEEGTVPVIPRGQGWGALQAKGTRDVKGLGLVSLCIQAVARTLW